MPHVVIFFSQLEKQTINSVFVWGIMQKYMHFFWFQHTLFNISGIRPPNYKGTASSSQGVACRSPDGSMPQGAWTARARSTLLAALIIIELLIFIPCFGFNIWSLPCRFSTATFTISSGKFKVLIWAFPVNLITATPGGQSQRKQATFVQHCKQLVL